MFVTGSTDKRQLQQLSSNSWAGVKPVLQISLMCLAIAPGVVQAKDGWGCEIGADGKWNCFWSGEGEPPAQQIQTPPPKPKPIASPSSEQEQQGVRNGLITASPVDETTPAVDSTKQPTPAAEPESETAEKSTFGRLKSWFGLAEDEPTDTKNAEPDLAHQPPPEPSSESEPEKVMLESRPDIPQPKTDDVPLAEQTASTEKEEKDDGVSTLNRLRGWLGWTSEGKSPEEDAPQEAPIEPKVVDSQQSAPISPSTMQNQPITEDAVISALDSKATPEKKSAEKPDKPSTMGKMKKWLGLSEDGPAKKVDPPKAEQQSVIAEIKQYQDYSISPDLSDLQFTPSSKGNRQRDESSEGNKPSTAKRLKSWLGFSDKQKAEADKTASTTQDSANKPPAVVASRTPPAQIMGIDSDRVVETEAKRTLPTSMIKPDSSLNGEKRETTANKEKSSWFSRVGSWFGFGGKEQKAEGKDMVTVMPDMKIEDVPAK